MAKNITAQVVGGTPKVIEAKTVQNAFDALELSGNYTATVNGNPAKLEDSLNDYEFVYFTVAVKGGC